MKKLSLLFAALTASTLMLGNTSCSPSNDKVQLMYGTSNNVATTLKFADLEAKMNTFKENMLIAIYPGEESHCLCWTDFSMIIDDYVSTTHTTIYKINVYELRANHNDWGFKLSNSAPTFHITENGEIKHYFDYDNQVDSKIFHSSIDFANIVELLTYEPNYVMVDEAYLENKIFTKKEKSIVFYTKSTCGDCMYAVPRVLAPFQAGKKFSTKVMVIDIESYAKKGDSEYNAFKDKFFLSDKNDQTFGYGRGYVPTYQVYEDGILKDMGVYFNDSVSKIDNKFIVTQTYYTNERLSNLHYEAEVLMDMEIKPSEIDQIKHEGKTYYRWNHDASNKYHQAFFESFLNKYAI